MNTKFPTDLSEERRLGLNSVIIDIIHVIEKIYNSNSKVVDDCCKGQTLSIQL